MFAMPMPEDSNNGEQSNVSNGIQTNESQTNSSVQLHKGNQLGGYRGIKGFGGINPLG